MRAKKSNFCTSNLGLTAILYLACGCSAYADADAPPANPDNAPQASHSLDSENPLWLTLEDYVAPPVTPGLAYNDLLQRLREGFELDATLNHRVQAELNWFVGHPQYLERVFSRSQRYLPYITRQLEARALPLELALLPMVESAYDPFAYSHGRAAGLWQIIPGTARRFGIRQNWWYDGRRDIVDSTAGALKYLSYLKQLVGGDWLLAIAAYNSGEGNVLKAVRRNRARDLPTDFWHLRLSRETSSYVPKLLALVEIVKHPASHGLALPELLYQPQFVGVDVGGQLDLALAAELAGTELNLLHSFNSGLNRWATDPGGAHRLLVPIAGADRFVAALQKVPVEERVRWRRHKVVSGDSVSEIAEKYHTTAASVRSANSMRNNRIRAGDYLMIPVARKPLAAYGETADARRSRTQNRPRVGKRIEHRVTRGESFWTISRHYGVTTRQLAAWNGMAPRDTLSIGQRLIVWTEKPGPQTTAMSVGSNATTRKLHYTVRRGDSLYLIASRFRITIKDLVRWNRIDRNKVLHPGQELTLFVDVTAQSSS